MTADENEEWEEWNMEITFTFTYVTEGPFPEDMPDEERAKKVKEAFDRNWWEEFYHAYDGASRTQIDASEPEKYSRE
jgi:hypothetical protein